MTPYSLTIGLLLAFPWGLVTVVLLGTAAKSARRWLDNCQWCGARSGKTGSPGR
jgi:hypothetical protein